MVKIKKRRLNNSLSSYTDLKVGDCVPFYFCPRSVMLFMFHKNNHIDITYKEGQEPIIHLEYDFMNVINWANKNKKRWVFTKTNAGSNYFEDYNDLEKLNNLNWEAINATFWPQFREEKQAEFLIENLLPWKLVESIGVFSNIQQRKVDRILQPEKHHLPPIIIKPDWYY